MRFVYLVLFSLIGSSAWSQCPHDPRITGDTILCPNQTGLLEVQTAEAYQWYLRSYGSGMANPIPGDTNKTLQINDVDHVLTYISVETEINGCVERSPEVLIDGYAFLPPTVQSTGSFRIGQNGESLLCTGDTVFFELMLPYTENIQWYNGGNPIPGAIDPLFVATQSGYYTVEGAPYVCPNYIVQLGVTLEVIKYNTVEPDFGLGNDTFFVDNAASFQEIKWYRNDTLIQTGGAWLVPTSNGAYGVETVDQNGCESSILPGIVYPPLGIPRSQAPNLHIYPTLTQDILHLRQTQPQPMQIRVVDATGRVVYHDHMTTIQQSISTAHWPTGMYWVQWQSNTSNWEHRQISVVR